MILFFFSSRRRHTICGRDWSSDVCSSDLGVHPNAVGRWMKRYRDGGFHALAERRRGRRAGEQAALSASQQQEVIALVRDSTPDQLGLAGFLWTREVVAELI